MNGLTVGEAYQRLLNGLIAEGGIQPYCTLALNFSTRFA
jgi:hypothetical protein